MFNVIPPIATRKASFGQQKNNFSAPARSFNGLHADTTSFTGLKEVNFLQISRKALPKELYLSELEISKKLRSAKPNEVMSILSKEVGEIVAKRLDNFGILPKAEMGSVGHPAYSDIHPLNPFKSEEPSTFMFHPKRQYDQRSKMDWTEQYNGIKKVFEEKNYDIDSSKVDLYKVLREYNLMK